MASASSGGAASSSGGAPGSVSAAAPTGAAASATAASRPSPPGAALRFQPFASAVDVSFWQELNHRKLHEYRLSDAPVPIVGFYEPSPHVSIPARLAVRRESFGPRAAVGGTARRGGAAAASVDGDSAKRATEAGVATEGTDDVTQLGPVEVAVPGVLVNVNTVEAFKTVNKQQLLDALGAAVWHDMQGTGEDAAAGSGTGAATEEEDDDDAARIVAGITSHLGAHGPSSGLAVTADGSVPLARFIVLTFADLKEHRYMYWFGFPALVASTAVLDAPVPPVTLAESRALSATELAELPAQVKALAASAGSRVVAGGREVVGGLPSAFLVRPGRAGGLVAPLSSFASLDATAQRETLLAFVDPCPLAANPGWPLRNLLALAATRLGLSKARVLCYRPSRGGADAGSSLVLSVVLAPAVGASTSGKGDSDSSAAAAAPETYPATPKVVGWETNAKGKPGPRLMSLKSQLDPATLAASSVNLNLNLMKWRALPSLDNEALASTRCLLFGAGTLGCFVARALLAWGIKHITFVDNGKVSFSNPVRQPLFEFADCLDGGKPKAAAAADALKRIFPGVVASGEQLSIPMPGHPVSKVEEDGVRRDVARIEELVSSHDIVFLLTDTRESRWLPTVLAGAAGKLTLNVALGFDTYLVMRHGMSAAAKAASDGAAVGASSGASAGAGASLPAAAAGAGDSATLAPADGASGRLGCYFCNDVVAPANSTRDRTLDRQCTVTRPGLAPIAGALAVELLVALLHHPQGGRAAADEARPLSESPPSPLGIVPHQVRGFLTHIVPMITQLGAFNRCTACSDAVADMYRERGFAFLLDAFNEPAFLERATGLDKVHEAADEAMMAWDDDDDDDGDDF